MAEFSKAWNRSFAQRRHAETICGASERRCLADDRVTRHDRPMPDDARTPARVRWLARSAAQICWWRWLLLAPIVAATGVSAFDNLDVSMERVVGAGWSAAGIALQLDLPQRAQARLTIARLRLPSPAGVLRNVRFDCLEVQLADDVIACHNAKIFVADSPLGPQRLRGRLMYRRSTRAVDVDLQNPRLAGDSIRIRAALREAGWDVRVGLQSVAVESLLKLARRFHAPLPQIAATGTISGEVHAHGADSLQAANAILQIAALTANNAAGSLATDKLSLAVDARAQRSAGRWAGQMRIRSAAGQAYAEPVFLDFGAHAIDVMARGSLDDGELSVDSFTIEHQQTLSASGTAQLQLAVQQPLRDLSLTLHSLQFPGAYISYLQPLLLDTNFKSLTTAGKVSGSINVSDGIPQRVDLRLSALDVDDGVRNLVLHGVEGEWHWRNDAVALAGDRELPAALQIEDSRLQWSGGALLNLDLGAAQVKFATRGRQLRLLEPTRLPLLDGAIELESFRIRNAGEPTVAFMVDATIQPIGVSRLSRAFGWPEFGGSIGGAISKLRMRDGVITLGTTLRAQVFDGEVTISDLRLEQPFGKWPRLASNIALRNLDLQLVTSAFSFGRITGRLSGAIDGLQLFNWQPVAFDANLYTPLDDPSPHRISQRAVENIGSIGGGGAGITQALSSGLLRFFEDFKYDRLGLSCRLKNEICQMNGVAPGPGGGYYLVKGKGVPRIDVVGSARQVDWPRLVQQLIAVTESEGPVVR